MDNQHSARPFNARATAASSFQVVLLAFRDNMHSQWITAPQVGQSAYG
jgi:hypothetical protein